MRTRTKLLKNALHVAIILIIFSISICLIDNVLARPTKSARISLLMATGLPGGVDYQVGLGLASLWTTRLKSMGIRVSAAISEGARENIEAIRIADADLMMADEFFCFNAFSGTGPYKDRPLGQLRAIAVMWPELLHIIVRSEKFNRGTIQDLESLTIGTGLPDSSSKHIMEQLLKETPGLKRDIKLKPLSNIAALEAWKSGAVQALNFSGGLPIPIVNFFAQQNEGLYRFLEISDSEISSLKRGAMTNIFGTKIPAMSYSGQAEDVHTIGQNNILATSVSLDKQVIYELTKTMFENVDYLIKIHPACAHISLEKALGGLKLPLHAGAIQYYREKNLNIPEELCIDSP